MISIMRIHVLLTMAIFMTNDNDDNDNDNNVKERFPS